MFTRIIFIHILQGLYHIAKRLVCLKIVSNDPIHIQGQAELQINRNP